MPICPNCRAIASDLGIDEDKIVAFVFDRGDEIPHECQRRTDPDVDCECPCNRNPIAP